MFDPKTMTGSTRSNKEYIVKCFCKTLVYSHKLQRSVRRWLRAYAFVFPTKAVALNYLRTMSRLTIKNGSYRVLKWTLSINVKGGVKRVK